ncbi:peptidoglycan recognition protein-lc [Culex quinquefasciatus]|uniref:Peptidoglycan recognition protein-lc n=1 Tax=Culex quinquefasciatus TaxID=7176 RepID=B0WKF7_CULQU|nr:peptidoglycan recognition protein-lc [Culex quinquefasciatus]|eukprot:XP_001849191.1 peptidoglycan recognition protein-lc [Culex quinquefasciatus]
MAHVPTAEWGFHCQACFWPDTTDMVNCAHCLTWWHTCCAGVDETVPVEERSFTCPRCQNPSFTVPKGKKPPSKASSGTSSTSDARARRARLRLEKLEAQKLLMEKHLEQARREQQIRHEQEKLQQEAEIDRAKLEIEQTILEETFRHGRKSWTMRSRMIVASGRSKAAKAKWNSGKSSNSLLLEPGQDVLGRALQGISLDQSTLEVGLGGMIDRTSSTLGTIYEVDPYDNPGYTNWQQAGPSHGRSRQDQRHAHLGRSRVRKAHSRVRKARSRVRKVRIRRVSNHDRRSRFHVRQCQEFALLGQHQHPNQHRCRQTHRGIRSQCRQIRRGIRSPRRQTTRRQTRARIPT